MSYLDVRNPKYIIIELKLLVKSSDIYFEKKKI